MAQVPASSRGSSGPVWFGPFAVTAATLPANGDYLHLCDLNAGQTLYDAYGIITAGFNGTGVEIGLAVSKRGDANESAQFAGGNLASQQAANNPSWYYVGVKPSGVVPFQITGADEFVAYLGNGTLGNAGHIDIYALIGTTPA